MRRPLYEITVSEIETDPHGDGAIVTSLDVRHFGTWAWTPEDAVLAWASRIEDEAAS
jgi:hypothetical protein